MFCVALSRLQTVVIAFIESFIRVSENVLTIVAVSAESAIRIPKRIPIRSIDRAIRSHDHDAPLLSLDRLAGQCDQTGEKQHGQNETSQST